MRAIVIDDSRAIRSILSRMLKGLGFEVLTAEHGRNALEVLAEEGPVDIALVDWNMPEMNGYEFLCEFRSDSANDDVKVMMVTTVTEVEQMIKALEAGANEYVMKPFDQESIQEKLKLLGVVGV